MSHYNNIFNKKNVEYSLVNVGDRLPYESKSKVTLNSNQIIFTSINNVLQRLLDNDLYNEALLKQYIDEGKIAGPVAVDSIEEVLSQYDENKKFVLSDENGLHIISKKLIPVSETLKGRYLDGNKVNKVSYANDSYVAATDTGFYVSDNKINWKKAINKDGIDFIDVCYNKNYLIDSDSLLSSFDWIVLGNSSEGIELFGHQWTSSGGQWLDFSTDPVLSNFNLFGKKGTHVFSFENDSKLFIGTKNDGLWSMDGKVGHEPRRENGTNGWKINDLVEINVENDYEKYLLATSHGIKQSSFSYGFSNLEKIKLFSKDVYVYKSINKNGSIYVATSAGLAKIQDGEVSWLCDYAAYDVIEYSGLICVACGKKGLFKVSDSQTLVQISTAFASKLAVFHGDLFLLTATQIPKIKYIKSKDIKRGKKISNDVENFSVSGLTVRDLVSTKDVLYIVTDDGIKCIEYKESIDKFVKDDFLSDERLIFSKNTSDNEVVIQLSDKEIFIISDTIHDLPSEGYVCEGTAGNLVLIDAARNVNKYYFLTEENTVYVLENGNVEKINGISASKIEIISRNLVYIDSVDGNVKLYDGNSIKKINVYGKFSDIGTCKNYLYGLSGETVTPFQNIQSYGLVLSEANPTYNVESTTKYKTERIYNNDFNVFELSNTSNMVEASSLSVKISDYDYIFEKEVQDGIDAMDFVGYAKESNLNDNPILVASENGIKAFARNDATLLPVQNDLSGAKGFADWRVYSSDEKTLLCSGTNFTYKDSKLYAKNLISLFFEDKKYNGIEKVAVLSNVLYFISANSFIRHDKKFGDTLLLSSDFPFNNILVDSRNVIVCGAGIDGVITYNPEDGLNNAYFPGDIQSYFETNAIESSETFLSDLNPELSDNSDLCVEYTLKNNGYNISAHNFTTFIGYEYFLSGNTISGNETVTDKPLLKGLFALSVTDGIEVSSIAYLYEDQNGDLIAEDVERNGYLLTLNQQAKSLDFNQIVDYIPINNDTWLEEISTNVNVDGIPLHYDQENSIEEYHSGLLDFENDFSQDTEFLRQIERNTIDKKRLASFSFPISSEKQMYSIKTKTCFAETNLLLSSQVNSVISVETYISAMCNVEIEEDDQIITQKAVSSIVDVYTENYLTSDGEKLISVPIIDFQFLNLQNGTSLYVEINSYVSGNVPTQTSKKYSISSNVSTDVEVKAMMLDRQIPQLMQKDDDAIYFGKESDDSGGTLFGYICQNSQTGDDYLLYSNLSSDISKSQFYLVSEFNKAKIEQLFGFACLKNVDISSEIAETVEISTGISVDLKKVENFKNDDFNDVFYYSIRNINDSEDFEITDSSLYVPSFSEKPKEFSEFIKSNNNGKIRSLKATTDYLYVLSDNNNILYTTKEDFNTYDLIQGIDSGTNIVKLESDNNCLYALDNNKKLYVIASNGIDRTVTSVKDIFSSNETVYYFVGNSIKRANDNETVLTASQFTQYDSFAALLSSDYYYSPVIVTDNKHFYSSLGYDLSQNYNLVHDFSGETISDVKVVEVGKENVLFVATDNKIYYEVLPSNSYSFSQYLDGFDGIKAFGFTALSNLVVLDNAGLKYFDDYISSVNIISNLTEMTLNTDYENLTASYRMSQRAPFYEEPQPLVIENSSNGSNYFVLSTVYSFKENPDEIRYLGIQDPQRFLRYDDYKLYVIGIKDVVCLENGLWQDKFNQINVSSDVFAINGNSEYWTLSDGLPFEIKVKNNNEVLSTYPTDLSDINGIFKLNSSVYYYSSSSNGIYGKEGVYSYETGENSELSTKTDGKNVYALDFIDGENYIYNYTSAVSNIASAYSGNPNDTWTVNATVSLFDSSLSAICANVNLNYDAVEGMQFIKNYKNYVFFTDGGSGYVYNTKTHNGLNIDFDDLVNMNDGSSKMMDLNSNGNICYGNLLANFDDFGRIFKFGTPVKDFMILGNTFKSETNVIEVLNSKPDFLIGSVFGLRYVFDKMITRTFYDRKDVDNSLIKNVATINPIDKENNYYIVSQGNDLYEITGLKIPKYKKILTLSSDETITSIFPFQKDEYLIATTKGLYTTEHKYEIQDDLTLITLSSVYRIINEELAKILEKHIEKDHISSDYMESFITKLNKKADAKLSFISSADKHVDVTNAELANGVKIVENDIIDTIVRGGEDPAKDTYVKVAVSNWATRAIETEATYSDGGFVSKFVDPTSGKEFDISTVPYIVKNWKSGLKEIYIYVPTTATYYLNNPQGMSNSQYTYNSTQRKNVPNTSIVNTLPNGATILRVYLYNSYFGIKTILAAQCVGNSLPLKIYKDNVNADDSWKGFFDTIVQPSTLKTLPMTNDGNVNNVRVCTDDQGRIVLDFAVYGTDAQAIRIIAES